MMKNRLHMFKNKSIWAALVLPILFVWGCDFGVDPSPRPGVLRVTLQAAPEDSVLEVQGQRYAARDRNDFEMIVFQGRALNDSLYADLYPDLDAFRQEDQVYDILEFEGGEPVQYTIFETHLPPATYDRLEFGLNADSISVNNETTFLDIGVDLAEGEEQPMAFETEFTITENDTTIIHLQVRPFDSITRFRDSYRFSRDFEIVGIEKR